MEDSYLGTSYAGLMVNSSLTEVTSYSHSREVMNTTKHGAGSRPQNTMAMVENIERYYMWVILVIGFPGNVGSIVTITKMSRLRSSTFYVAALATVDNVCLILKSVYMELKYEPGVFSNGGCKFIAFGGLITAAFSNWILVSMATERFLAVRFPLKVAHLWTLRRAVLLTGALFSTLFLLHLHLLWTIVSGKFGCDYAPRYRHFTDVSWYWISASVYAFIPCVLLIIFNFLIVYHIHQSSRLRRRLTYETSNNSKTKRASANNDSHITAMLVNITVVFVILTIPRCAVILAIKGSPARSESEEVSRAILNVITSILADSNHAVNFYLYFIAAKKFRYHFFRLILRQGRTRPLSFTASKPTLTSKEEEHFRTSIRNTRDTSI